MVTIHRYGLVVVVYVVVLHIKIKLIEPDAIVVEDDVNLGFIDHDVMIKMMMMLMKVIILM